MKQRNKRTIQVGGDQIRGEDGKQDGRVAKEGQSGRGEERRGDRNEIGMR